MTVTTVRLGGRPDQPLLVVGPSLGTSAMTLWGEAARALAADFQVVGWDLPGHGYNRALVEGPTTMATLARELLEALDRLTDSFDPVRFHYAGDSVGGAVGLQLLIDAPAQVLSATICCSAAHFGGQEPWQERIAAVTVGGTSTLVEGSKARWFGPGFTEREPQLSSALLQALADADGAGYGAVCAALGDYDLRDQLARITAPVLTIAGSDDVATPPEALALIADEVQDGRAIVLPGVGHLAPVEEPDEVARLIREFVFGPADEPAPDEHASQAALLIGLGALVALGHEDELAVQVRAVRRRGIDQQQLIDALAQGAAHYGSPAADTAVQITRRVFAEAD